MLQKKLKRMETLAKTKEMARTKLKSRGGEFQFEQMYDQATWTTLDTFETQPIGLQSQGNLKSPHEMSRSITMWSFKSNIQGKNTWCFHRHYIWAVTALPYQHWILSRDLSMKKLGILRTEMIFTLPRCLLLRVMCPLHLQELDGLVASLAIRRLKNTVTAHM